MPHSKNNAPGPGAREIIATFALNIALAMTPIEPGFVGFGVKPSFFLTSESPIWYIGTNFDDVNDGAEVTNASGGVGTVFIDDIQLRRP